MTNVTTQTERATQRSGRITASATIAGEPLLRLLAEFEFPCVSIYATMRTGGQETDENRIRLKNLFSSAAKQLQDGGMRRPDAERLLDPLRRAASEKTLHQPSAGALALLCTRGRHWRLDLPVACGEPLVVAERFHIKPLLPLARQTDRFYVLSFSGDRVRLLAGNRTGLAELDLPELPANMAEALRYDDAERQLQFHTRTPATTGDRPAVFHGQGTGKDDTKTNLLRFARLVDRAVATALEGQRGPLVLSAVGYLLPIYRQANSYPDLVDGVIAGSTDSLSQKELHTRAWKLVEPLLKADPQRAIDRYQEGLPKGRASDDIADVVLAAADARVDMLVVAADNRKWGRVDLAQRRVTEEHEPGPRSEDLLNVAAVLTLRNGGAVHVLPADEIPGAALAAAVYRF